MPFQNINNMYKIYFLSALFLSVINSTAQKNLGLTYGVQGGLQVNTAILPDIEINESISSVLEGDDVAKGVPQWANASLNYKIGGFVKYDPGFGFALFEINLTPAKIKKEITFTTHDFWGNNEYTLATLERNFTYLDFSLSYNINLSNQLSLSLGATPSFLLSNTGKETPATSDLRAFTGFTYRFSDKMAIATRVELGLSEVYKGSYIHHVMIPVVLQISL